jgi:hypothetical protein
MPILTSERPVSFPNFVDVIADLPGNTPDSLVHVPETVPVTVIRPTPTDDESAAIVAAVDALWPRAVSPAPIGRGRHTSWRFSGRWWSAPTPVRRDRPYL